MQTKNRLWCKSTGRIEINAKLFLNRQHVEGDKTAGPAGQSGADIPCGDELLMSRWAWLQRQVTERRFGARKQQMGKTKTHNVPSPSKPLWFLNGVNSPFNRQQLVPHAGFKAPRVLRWPAHKQTDVQQLHDVVLQSETWKAQKPSRCLCAVPGNLNLLVKKLSSRAPVGPLQDFFFS